MHFKFDDTKLLAPADRDAICAGPLKVVGAVKDSASGDTLRASSFDVTPGC